MKVFYTVFTHDKGDNLNYQGIENSATGVALFLKSKGYAIERENVSVMAQEVPKKWSNKVIVRKHLVDESELITDRLLKNLKIEGTKQAEEILKLRKQKRKL